jgi:hypothetical protein
MEGEMGWSHKVVPRGHCCEAEVCIVSGGVFGVREEAEGYFDPLLDRED